MKKIKILLVFLTIFITGCSVSFNNGNKNEDNYIENFNEEKLRNEIGKVEIKDNKIFYGVIDGKPEWSEDLYKFNSIEESVSNQLDDSLYGYEGQKIDLLVHKFEFKNGATKVIYLSKDKFSNKTMVNVNNLYRYPASNKYSNIFAVEEPYKLKSKMKISDELSIDKLVKRKVRNIEGLPIPKEPNLYFGITTNKNEANTLKIEKQRPKVKSFEFNETIYYFWYFTDLKTNKEIPLYKIEYSS